MLCEEKGVRPAISLYTQVGMGELAAKDHKTKHVYPELRLLFQNGLSDTWKLVYNLGPEWDGDASQPQWFHALGPEVEIGEKVEAFLEVFGRLQKGAIPGHQLDGGLAYYPAINIKLDISGGLGLSRAAPDYFVALGLSFQLKP